MCPRRIMPSTLAQAGRASRLMTSRVSSTSSWPKTGFARTPANWKPLSVREMNQPTVATHIMNAVLDHVRNNNSNRIAFDEALPQTKPAPRKASSNGSHAAAPAPRTEKTVLHLGFDWGTNKSCLKASYSGSNDMLLEEIIPTVVGYAKE